MRLHSFVTSVAFLFLGTAAVTACHSSVSDPSNAATSVEVPVAGAIPPYERDAFGSGWTDSDGDCRNTRMQVLADMSLSQVRYDAGGCRVVSGRWISEYTGKEIYQASEIDIDHVVALAYAWRQGAYAWTPEARRKFANDTINLRPVESSLNRSKGDSSPSEWLPELNQCSYVSRFYRVVKTYHLELPTAELEFIDTKLEQCRSAG